MSIEVVEIDEHLKLADYEELAYLAEPAHELRSQGEIVEDSFRGRTLWMVNSSATGGGVAEMLPKMVSILRELGIDTRWAVIGTEREEFFELTKRLHNLIHGVGEPVVSAADRELYEAVSQENAEEFRKLLRPRDLIVIHDPQPLGMGPLIRESLEGPLVWRCHIGLDRIVPATRAAWRFLEPYTAAYDHAVFSAGEYIPEYLAGRASVIHPAIDPLSHKNRELEPHKLTGVVCNASLAMEHAPVLTEAFRQPARRLQPDGRWLPAAGNGEIGLLYRPIVTQISRWDRLKGFAPLLEAFVHLKQRRPPQGSERHRHRLEIVRLVLAGPDPSSVADDPEGLEVLELLERRYLELDQELQEDIVLLSLPMESRKENALMVNALQRCSSVVVQNSLQEGFGLTVTEAMWKRLPVLASSACGIRQQIRDGLDGCLVSDAEDAGELARTLDELLADPEKRATLARSAQRRVYRNFLIFNQLSSWLTTLDACLQQKLRSPGR
jgi:trehalose synthase